MTYSYDSVGSALQYPSFTVGLLCAFEPPRTVFCTKFANLLLYKHSTILKGMLYYVKSVLLCDLHALITACGLLFYGRLALGCG